MFHKKFSYILPLFLLFVYNGSAQVVTSKKQAVKKGIYQAPAEKAVADNTKVAQSKTEKPEEVEASDYKPTASENYLAVQMINNAMSFIGVRYRGGGTTTAGMDCSGMVTAVAKIFDLELPRSSREMAKVGKKLDKHEVQKGDLIFFKTNGKSIINHVGMVIEVIGDEIKFVHSSTSKGVIVSSTKEPYYKKAFAQANRIL